MNHWSLTPKRNIQCMMYGNMKPLSSRLEPLLQNCSRMNARYLSSLRFNLKMATTSSDKSMRNKAIIILLVLTESLAFSLNAQINVKKFGAKGDGLSPD